MSTPVEVVDYDPTWPRTFEKIRATIAACLAGLTSRIEHVGSTAVPGLAAKPIVDVDVLLDTNDVMPDAIARLSHLGYRHEGNLGIPGREAFSAPADMPHHHLYVCPPGSEEFGRHIAFRNYLRSHPVAAGEYAALKQALASQVRYDRKAYTNGKHAFVRDVLSRAKENR